VLASACLPHLFDELEITQGFAGHDLESFFRKTGSP